MIFDFVLTFFVFILVCVVIDHFISTPRYKGPKSDHFNGRVFSNISDGKKHLIDVSSNRYNRFTSLPIFFWKRLDSKVWHIRPLPNGEAKPPACVGGGDIHVTYVNHATILIQTENMNILTDPVWVHRIGPFSFIGPKRYMQPGISIHSLPKVDCILLSHNHYDHMDIMALQKITHRDKPIILTLLGNTKFLRKKKIYKSADMDWGMSHKLSDKVSVDCVPAQHFSARGVTDRNTSLWGGFVIRTLHGNIYFAGDTGYGHSVDKIKALYPKGFRLAFLPIGAYEPAVMMRIFHASPDDAVRIHKELGIQHCIPIHFGTFDLALDGQDDPENKLKNLLEKEGNKDVKFTVLHNGQNILLQ